MVYGVGDKMILRINEQIYYENKEAFKNAYKKLKMKWIEDRWKNDTSSLIKLEKQDGCKRFEAIDCPRMVEFLKGIGAIEEKKVGVQIKEKEIETPIKEYKIYCPDLDSHRIIESILKDLPLNWGVKWK